MSAKDLIRKLIQSLLEDMTVEEIAYRIYFEEKIRKARLDKQNKAVFTQQEAEEILNNWISKIPN
ncbi:MAG: hypothetical protein ACTSYU_08685 [Promethearchaeota archaeon]